MSSDKENGAPGASPAETGPAGVSPAGSAGGGAASGIPRDKLAEGVLKMFRGSGFPHVLLAFADEAGAYWVAHTGTYQIYRLHRLAGVVVDEIQAKLDRAPVAPAVVPTEEPKP